MRCHSSRNDIHNLRSEIIACGRLAQVELLAQQVADLQDEAEGRADAHSERVAALQATVERLSADAEQQGDERTKELEATIKVLEEQVLAVLFHAAPPPRKYHLLW